MAASGGGELEAAKKNLAEALGESLKQYWANMKLWFKHKISKEEFDSEARRLLTQDMVHLHNDFLLAIITKCQIMVTASGLKEGPGRPGKPSRKKKLPSLRGKFEHRFQEQDPLAGASWVGSRACGPDGVVGAGDGVDGERAGPTAPALCVQSLLLPALGEMMGRAMLVAWEAGLDSVSEETVLCLQHALQNHLKAVVTAMLVSRRPHRVKDGRFRYAYGTTAPLHPYLRNSCVAHRSNNNTDSESLCRPGEEAEERAALLLACSGSEVVPSLPPISLVDLQQALTVHKQVMPSHTMWSLNMERILARRWHPDREEVAWDVRHRQLLSGDGAGGAALGLGASAWASA
ncbi:transcriptional adapter 1 [Petromyzon marinus]|uniref:Transcriptional adapter 1 n=1 Tax=Petromyzon marinus TaxID=7757 RepID=A0AAJ7U3D3_PETMA|nr:transcriptional adapter 1 [Petromyzon marinus]